MSRFVLTEMRTDPAYRSTEIYALNRRFTSTVVTVIEHGIADGTLRDDVSPTLVRDMVFGCIENRAWAYLREKREKREKREFPVAETADSIARVVVSGLAAAPLREREKVEAALDRLETKAAALSDEVAALRLLAQRPRGS